MKQFSVAILLCITATLIISCSQEKITPSEHNSIYHWKSKFEPSQEDLTFLKQHKIDRIYLKMFDLVLGYDWSDTTLNVIPQATTLFMSPIPDGIEIVPVTYITIEALRAMKDLENIYAKLIVERMKAMCRYNDCGEIHEMQLDCDWTKLTKESYIKLCNSVKELLKTDSIELSLTIRLHQLNETPPPSDKGVLMIYNTGSLINYNTKNSILDIKDVKPYLKNYNGKYPIPLDYAYPAYGWGVKFTDKKFKGIVAENATSSSENDVIRVERPKFDEIIDVKELVEKYLGKPANSNILYHLDAVQLKNYSDNEIDQIFAR